MNHIYLTTSHVNSRLIFQASIRSLCTQRHLRSARRHVRWRSAHMFRPRWLLCAPITPSLSSMLRPASQPSGRRRRVPCPSSGSRARRRSSVCLSTPALPQQRTFTTTLDSAWWTLPSRFPAQKQGGSLASVTRGRVGDAVHWRWWCGEKG